MTTIRRHNPQLRAKLLRCAESADGAALSALLRSLSNSERRTAGYLLAEEVLPAGEGASARFWPLFSAVVPADTRAYLGTFLKAAVKLCAEADFTVRNKELAAFAAEATAVDCAKVLEYLLPALTKAEEMAALLALFCRDNEELRLSALLKADTPLSFYFLFQALRHHEGDHNLLRHYAVLLIRRGGQLSFNMANAIRSYFGLENVPGVFSLQLPPYMLNRLDATPELFIKTINNGKI